MACQCRLPYSTSSSSSSSSSSFSSLYKKRFRLRPVFFAQIQNPKPEEDEKYYKTKKQPQVNLLTLSSTLTIISTSLPPQAAAAAAVVKKRSPKKTTPKKVEALTPEELKSWAQGLPIVSDRIPYTELLEFKREGKLKHVIKQSSNSLRHRPESVLVVLEDSRVFRTVLPSLDGNGKFWQSWDELNIDSQCVNAYTPPVKKPEMPAPYLGFLGKLPEFVLNLAKPKKESKRAMELRMMREQMKREKKEELERMRKERDMMEKAIKVQRKEEERRKRREARKKKSEEALQAAKANYRNTSNVWAHLARDPNVVNGLGVLFFVIFYRTVVLSYKKQKKDYEDRLKIEKAEAEERKKMKELERQMQGMEDEDEDEDSEQGGAETNANLKMAMQFMKSGARVRRAQNRRLPQYLERGVDVKFSDVAGLGKIRLELEEIVKFFTHGEMYRRRGVKIPG